MSQLTALPRTEIPFLARMLAKDAKNYHVWSYRQWLVRHFSLWSSENEDEYSELPFLESLLRIDVRNNSAWNHRFFVLFGRDADTNLSDEIWDREIEFAKAKIFEAPQNQSAWNYLKGLLKRRGRGFAELECFAGEFADLEKADEVKSSHALDFLADIWAQKQEPEKAKQALGLLAERYDPVRKNYWEYRKGLLPIEAKV